MRFMVFARAEMKRREMLKIAELIKRDIVKLYAEFQKVEYCFES